MKNKAALLLLGILIFFSCSDERPTGVIKVKINNNSSNKIFVDMNDSSSEIGHAFSTAPSRIIEIGASDVLTRKFYGGGNEDFMWVFIYDEATILNHTWDEIKNNQLYDKRFQLSITDGQLNISDEIDFDLNYPN